MNPLWFILFGLLGFFVGLFVGFFFGGGCHVGHDGECFGKRIGILLHAFDVTGPSVSEKHVQGA